MELIAPKEIQVKTLDGEERTYIISKMPALAAREVVTQYAITAMPKVGEYKANEELMLKMMNYVSAIKSDGGKIALSTRALIDNHVPDYETLMKLEAAMFDYNTSFFARGRSLLSSASFEQKAAQWIFKMLTALSEQLSQKAKQPSTN